MLKDVSRFTKLWAASIFSLLLLFSFAQVVYAAPSPEGRWQTIDDQIKKPKGVVQVWVKNGVLYGKIVDRYKENIKNSQDYCTKCPGSLKNKPMIGLVFLSGLKQQSDGSWSGGTIVDPESGKTYKCSLKVSPDGKKLYVRGYMGVSLLGRTQTWYRLK